MARSVLSWMRLAAVAAFVAQTAAQQCYYPNGNLADKNEKPCSTAKGSACCPDKWECLDNGLCHYPANNLYGRYSCTDKDWKSPGCASNMCTYGMTLGGGESITQCSDHNNDWCCNGDNQHVNCCKESPAPRPFFQLQDGKAYATIGVNQASRVVSLDSITGSATYASGSGPPKTSAPGASSQVTSSAEVTSSSAKPITSVSRGVSSGPAGVVTIERTIVTTPTSAPASATQNNSKSSKSNIGLIVGCAVGIPLALALLGIVFWMLRKRRQQKAHPYKDAADIDSPPAASPAFAGGAAAKLGKKDVYRHSRPGTTEIDSNPVGPGRPVSQIPGHSELDSGTGFRPGQGNPYAPDTVGIGGGIADGRSTWGSAPPGYSPTTNQAAFTHPPGVSELPDTSILPAINEKEGAQQYQAYRPPQPVAELPTVKTPPEDVEKQIQR